MRKFLVKTILIVLFAITPLVIADYVSSKNYRNRDHYPFTTMTDIVEGRLNSDLWILGSSRALVQYNPRILDSMLNISSYNLGMNAQFIVPEILCYRIACEYNKKPKYILLDLMWRSLTMETAPVSRYFYMPYIFNYKVRRNICNNNIFSFEYLNVPYYRFHTEKHEENNYMSCLTYKGFQARDIPWSSIDLDGLDTIHYHREPRAIELLDSFLFDCRKNHISVIIIHSPFQRYGFEKIHNHNEMLDFYKGIADRHNIPFLDYSNDPISFDTLNFYNSMHLNAHGADLFSAKLAHDLDSLGLIPSKQ